MAVIRRPRQLVLGAGSLADLCPAPGRVEAVRNRRRMDRVTPVPVVYRRIGAGAENVGLAWLLAHAEFLARHPEAAQPDIVRQPHEWFDRYAELPPVARLNSDVGGRRMDAAKIAVDRWRVRQRLVARGRQLLADVGHGTWPTRSAA